MLVVRGVSLFVAAAGSTMLSSKAHEKQAVVVAQNTTHELDHHLQQQGASTWAEHSKEE